MEEIKFLISLNRLLHNLKGFVPTTNQGHFSSGMHE